MFPSLFPGVRASVTRRRFRTSGDNPIPSSSRTTFLMSFFSLRYSIAECFQSSGKEEDSRMLWNSLPYFIVPSRCRLHLQTGWLAAAANVEAVRGGAGRWRRASGGVGDVSAAKV